MKDVRPQDDTENHLKLFESDRVSHQHMLQLLQMIDDQTSQMRNTTQRIAGSKEREEQVIKIKRDHRIPSYYAKELNDKDLKRLKEVTKIGLFKTYNKDKLRNRNVTDNVDKMYAEFIKE